MSIKIKRVENTKENKTKDVLNTSVNPGTTEKFVGPLVMSVNSGNRIKKRKPEGEIIRQNTPPEIPDSLDIFNDSGGKSDDVDDEDDDDNSSHHSSHSDDLENNGDESAKKVDNIGINKYSIKKTRMSDTEAVSSGEGGENNVLRLQTQLTPWFTPKSQSQAQDLYDKCQLNGYVNEKKLIIRV